MRLPSPKRPSDKVKIDGTELDFLVSPDGGRTWRRPFISVAMDVETRMVIGFHLAFGAEAPAPTGLGKLLKELS